MMTEQKTRIIQQSLQHLAATHAGAVAEIERTMRVLAGAMDLAYWSNQASATVAGIAARHDGVPVADWGTLSVLWQGQSCFLGNTLPFRFFERLARTPNRYVSHDDLLDDVWGGGPRESTTIRGVAKRLRDRLVAAGMEDLAQSVKGSESGYYGLIFV
jgi:DNA-binding response OmpR family regulator